MRIIPRWWWKLKDEIKYGYQRIRLGFDPRDTWGLDTAMAKWMAPRLRHLADYGCGAPMGYGTTPDDITFDTKTDFGQWYRDIMRAAKFFEDHANEQREWTVEEGNRMSAEQIWVFGWMSEYYCSLWW
jgi:hypothetical protein